MTILLTGSSGFLGSRIAKELGSRGLQWRPLIVRLHEARAAHLENISTVIHAAAQTPRIGLPEERYWPVNVEGTEHLLKLCEENRVARFIYVSSMGVKFPTPYSRTKLVPEESVKRSRMQWLILRPAHLYGANEHWKAAFESERKRKVRFVIGFGANPVAIAHVNDCAAAIVDAATSNLSEQTFNVMEPEIPEIRYWRILRKAINARFMIIPVPRFLARMRLGDQATDDILSGYRISGIPEWPYAPAVPLEAGLKCAYEELK